MLAACASAQTVSLSGGATANLASFDHVWTTVRDRHWDPTSLEPAWTAARERLRPQVARTLYAEQARPFLKELLEVVGLSHYTADGAVASRGPAACSNGDLGVEWRLLDGRLVVVRVLPGRAADLAGIRTGWSLAATEPPDPCLGVPTTYDFDVGDGIRQVAITAGPWVDPVAKFGNLPAMSLRYESRALGEKGQVGYVALSIFLDPPSVLPRFEGDLAKFADKRGLILDLRGNPGGIGAMALGMGKHFVVGQNHALGTLISRDASLRFVLNGGREAFAKPLAILIDNETGSTSEILAQGLKELGLARIFGEASAGQALPSNIEILPNGDRFQYAVANYVTAKGYTIEGRGVVPDVVVPWRRSDLLAGRDAALDAALKWVMGETGADEGQTR
jgi:carboxyl-terminal processing protease